MTPEHAADALRDVADEALVELVVGEGSEPAFRALHRRHAPRVYRVALRMLGAEADAEDAVQELWLRAVPKLGAFAWKSTLSTWLTGIVVNVCRETLERRGRWVMLELDEDVASDIGRPTSEPIDLERAIGTLPAACRAAFILHDVEGFTHEEIAAQMGYTAGTSRTQVFRARRSLRRLLGDAAIENAVGDVK
jgi:RNA polymerase sigma-70 factor (ECF subfamily)